MGQNEREVSTFLYYQRTTTTKYFKTKMLLTVLTVSVRISTNYVSLDVCPHTPALCRCSYLVSSSYSTGWAWYDSTDCNRHMITDDTRRSFVVAMRRDYGVHFIVDMKAAESYM